MAIIGIFKPASAHRRLIKMHNRTRKYLILFFISLNLYSDVSNKTNSSAVTTGAEEVSAFSNLHQNWNNFKNDLTKNNFVVKIRKYC